MKTAVTPVLLVIAAVVQSLGLYQYHGSSIVVSGQLFFSLFLAGIGVFYGPRGRTGAFSAVRLALLVLAAVALVATLVGWGMTLYQLYPAAWMFYTCFGLLLLNAVLCIAATPARAKRTSAEDADDAAADRAESMDREDAAQASGGATAASAEPAGEAEPQWRTSTRRRRR